MKVLVLLPRQVNVCFQECARGLREPPLLSGVSSKKKKICWGMGTEICAHVSLPQPKLDWFFSKIWLPWAAQRNAGCFCPFLHPFLGNSGGEQSSLPQDGAVAAPIMSCSSWEGAAPISLHAATF